MTILVTGGAGFIGANFVADWFHACDEPLINVDKLTYAGNLHNLDGCLNDPRHTFIHADILDRERIRSILKEYSPRAIIHFAAESHVDRSLRCPQDFVQTNSLGTSCLLEDARLSLGWLDSRQRSRFRFINVSTDEVFGSLEPDDEPFTESSSFKPNSPYSASKAAADHFARAWFRSFGLPVITTHSSNNYGPRQFPEKLIPLAILCALRGKSLGIYGDGLNVRDWLYVSDHCAALRLVLERGVPGENYNIGGNNELANISVIQNVCTVLDRLRPGQIGDALRRSVKFVADRPGHDHRYALNTAKIRDDLGWRPEHSLGDGLLKTVQWYLDNPQWIQNVERGIYQDWTEQHYPGLEKV